MLTSAPYAAVNWSWVWANAIRREIGDEAASPKLYSSPYTQGREMPVELLGIDASNGREPSTSRRKWFA
jgi:hypothetical protein